MSVAKSIVIPLINGTKRCSLLDLLPSNKEKLVMDVKASGRLDCSYHDFVEFRILREAR